MIDGAQPVGAWQRQALVVRDRHERRIGKVAHDLRQAGDIQAAVDGREERHARPGEQWQVQPIDMAMDDIELGGTPRHGFEQHRLHGDRIGARPAETKGVGPYGTSLARVCESPLANSVTS